MDIAKSETRYRVNIYFDGGGMMTKRYSSYRDACKAFTTAWRNSKANSVDIHDTWTVGGLLRARERRS